MFACNTETNRSVSGAASKNGGTGQLCGCGRNRTRAYLQEVHARPCDPPRERLELDSPVVRVGRELVCHRVVPRPLPSSNVEDEHKAGIAQSVWGETHPNFEDNTAASIGVQIVEGVLVIAAEVRVGHGLTERDAAPEAALALELDHAGAHSTVVAESWSAHAREGAREGARHGGRAAVATAVAPVSIVRVSEVEVVVRCKPMR